MSKSTYKEIHCPSCGMMQSITMQTSVTAGKDPDIRRRIMEESLFDFHCKECGYTSVFYYPCLYHDAQRKFLIYLNPSVAEQSLRPQIPEILRSLRKRLVSTVLELKEKILIFESGFNDIAMEIVKLAAENTITKEMNIPTPQLYFVSGNQEAIRFSVFEEKGKPGFTHDVDIRVYNQALTMLKASGFRETGGFQRIDRMTTQRILQMLQSRKSKSER